MIKSYSIGGRMHHRLSQGKFNGFVHSTFSRAVNLYDDENGELYCLSLPEIGNSPNGLQVEKLPPFQNGALPLHFEAIGSFLLAVGSKFIDLSKVAVWQPLQPAEYLNAESIARNFALLLDEVRQHEKCPLQFGRSLCTAIPKNNVYKAIVDTLPLLYRSLDRRDSSLAKEAAHRIVGLGEGLTPSGDDFLAGFMTGLLRGYAAASWKNDGILSSVKVLLNEAKTLTNLISYTQLAMAGNGEEPERINTLMNLLFCRHDENKLAASIYDVLQIGHTSGIDLLIGIIASADFIKDRYAGGKKVANS